MASYALDHRKTGNFLKINKPFVMDPALSETAKIVLEIALCYKPEKNVTPAMLENHMAAGATAIRSAIRALEERGYVHIRQGRFNGKFTTTTYDYYESPDLNPYHQKGPSADPVTTVPANDVPDPVSSYVDNPHTDYPHAVNQYVNNTDINYDIDINNTQNNNTSISNNKINQSIFPNISRNRIDEIERMIRMQIDYDHICEQCPRRYVDDIVCTMLTVMVQDSDTIAVSRDVSYPTAFVQHMFGKINPLHVTMIIQRMKEQNPNVTNMRSYLLTCLINAVSNMETSYQYGDII